MRVAHSVPLALAALSLAACASAPATDQARMSPPMAMQPGRMDQPLGQTGGQLMGQPGISFSGAKADADMQAVIDAHGQLPYRAIETLEPAAARLQPTAADAAKVVMQRRGIAAPPAIPSRNITWRGPAGNMPARLYLPAATTSGPRPAILYFHGGGFVIADINTYEASALALARETGAAVISVEYRRAPEAKFPAQQDDAIAAYAWTLANARSLGIDPRRIAVAGESAGGNLAVNVVMAARDRRMQAPAHMLLVYPVAGVDLGTASYRENANAKFLNRAMMAWFVHHTVRTPADANDPRLNLLAANLTGLPPATIVLAQIDPLRSDGEMLAARLRAAGVDTQVRTFDGAAHEFFGMDAVVADAKDAQVYAGQRLKDALAPQRITSR